MTQEHLSNIDTALLQVDEPTNPMVAAAIMLFSAPIEYPRLQATFEARLLSFRRFRQRIVWPALGPGNPYWEDDPDFDLSDHLHRVILPPPGDQATLQEVVSLLISTPMDLSRAPWQAHLIENYDQCCALLLQVHHSLADGVAIVHTIFSMSDPQADTPWPVVKPHSSGQNSNSHWPGWLQRGRASLRTGRRLARGLVREGLDLLADPAQARHLGEMGRDAVAELSRFILHEPEPDTVLRGELGIEKRAAWSDGIPLEEIKIIRRQLGGTVNDVLLAVVAGALRRYMQERGDTIDGLSIRVVVPVNMRPAGKESDLGNHLGAVFLTLPVGIADPIDRLRIVERTMNGRKDSMEAPAFSAALNLLGLAPAKVANLLINTFGTRATAVMTNVPGPHEQLYLAGTPIDGLMGWVPVTGRMAVGVSIVSYAGEVRLGVLADAGVVPDPEAILAGFHVEFRALLALVQKS
ncbi:MAG: wax ester/triacylglycerol synthase family O-acyltransferase [Anaerolineae bacterium]